MHLPILYHKLVTNNSIQIKTNQTFMQPDNQAAASPATGTDHHNSQAYPQAKTFPKSTSTEKNLNGIKQLNKWANLKQYIKV